MVERNITRYRLEQPDKKIYFVSTSLINDKLKISCQNSYSKTYAGIFSLTDLAQISQYFSVVKSIELVQKYLNGIIERQRIEIIQNEYGFEAILHLINNDSINIPLTKRIFSTNSYTNMFNKYSILSPTSTENKFYETMTHFGSPHKKEDEQLSQFNTLEPNSPEIEFASPEVEIPLPQAEIASPQPINSDENINYEIPNDITITTINRKIEPDTNNMISNQISSKSQKFYSPVSHFSHFDPSVNINIENNNLIKKQENKINPQHEKITNELKKVSEQVDLFMKDINKYKEENAKLNKQLIYTKKENLDLKKQINSFKNEKQLYEQNTKSLKNDFFKIQKDILSSNKKIMELLAKNKQYEAENENMKKIINEINKEKSNMKLEIEKYKKNSLIAKKNEEETKKLKEELKIYVIKSKEIDILKTEIVNLQSQIKELMKENENEEKEENEEENEEISEKKEEPKENQGDIIHNLNELELITKNINRKNKKVLINLLYKASIDSDKAAVFHQKCDNAKSSIVLVETKDGKRFGGYTTCSWSGNCIEKEDDKAFIFSFDKMKTYNNIFGENAIGCYPKFGPVFLGCQIKIYDDAFTKGGTTYEKEVNYETKEDYELTGGKRTFEVKDIEVYEVVFEKL